MYILEGNIGAGKTTFLRLLAHHRPGITISLEPLQEWHQKNQQGSLLHKFYDDPKRWAYTMETIALMSRVREHLKDQEHISTALLIERSIYSGHYCFALNSFEQGFMSPAEWHIHKQLFDFLVPQNCNPPRGFIYLQADPEVSFNRIQKRSRNGENSISLDYLSSIHKKHDEFLLAKKNIHQSLSSIPVLVLDGNEEFEENSPRMAHLFSQIDEFIYDTFWKKEGRS
jgi:deoxyadenosine/deoxycytidine kinase